MFVSICRRSRCSSAEVVWVSQIFFEQSGLFETISWTQAEQCKARADGVESTPLELRQISAFPSVLRFRDTTIDFTIKCFGNHFQISPPTQNFLCRQNAFILAITLFLV